MPLTPEDVRNKRFTPVRLREGYDMGEVDQFLDEVEAELERLTTENTELRGKLEAPPSRRRQPTATTDTADTVTEPVPDDTEVAEVVEVVDEPSPSPSPNRAGFVEPPAPAPRTVREAAGAAARLLEIAGRNADEVVAEPRSRPTPSSPRPRPSPSGSRTSRAARPTGSSRTPGRVPRSSTPRPPPSAPSCSVTSSGTATSSPARWSTCGRSSASTAAG